MSRSLLAAVVFALVTVALFLLRATPIGSTAPIIPMLLAGMTAMAAILALQQWSLEGTLSGSGRVTSKEKLPEHKAPSVPGPDQSEPMSRDSSG